MRHNQTRQNWITKISSMTEELMNLQMENKDLETKLRDISASIETKDKVS